MKIQVNGEIVRGMLNYIRLELNTDAMTAMWKDIRKDWKSNPLKVKGSVREFLKQMQDKFKMLDDFATMIMCSAQKAKAKIKQFADIDPDTKLGAEALEASARFMDSCVSFPMTFTGRLLEFFDKQVFYFLLQLFFYFRKKDIEEAK